MKRLQLALVLIGLGVLLPGVAIMVYATPPTQSTYHTAADAEYVGADTCFTCHTATHNLWEKTLHPLTIEDAQAEAALMIPDTKAETKFRIIEADGKPYTPMLTIAPEFAQGVLSSESNPHRYIMKMESGYTVIPDPVNRAWQTRLTIRFTDWLNGCTDCHLNTAALKALTDKIFLNGVRIKLNCESCHGPGSAHVNEHVNNQMNQRPQSDRTQEQLDPVNVMQEAETIHRRIDFAPTRGLNWLDVLQVTPDL